MFFKGQKTLWVKESRLVYHGAHHAQFPFFLNSEKKKEETYLHIALFIQDNVNKTMKTTQTIPETYR